MKSVKKCSIAYDLNLLIMMTSGRLREHSGGTQKALKENSES